MNARDKTISMNIIGELPDIILEQVTKLAYYYIGYMKGNIDYTTPNSIDFVNHVMDATNMINKIIAIAADGSDVEANTKPNGNTSTMLKSAYNYCKTYAPEVIEKINPQQPVETHANQQFNQNAEISEEPKDEKEPLETYLELFKSILDKWGIKDNTLSYKIIGEMPEYVISSNTVDMVIGKMVERYGKSIITIRGCLNYVFKNAKFENASELPKLVRSNVDVNTMLNELISLCLYIEN